MSTMPSGKSTDKWWIVWSIILTLALFQSPAAAAEKRATIPNSHLQLASLSRWAEAPAAQILHLAMPLALRNRDELNRLEAELQDHRSPNYHRWLTTKQFVARFGPSSQQVHTIATWLESRGINVTSASVKDRMIRFSGSVAIAEAAFGVRIVARGDSYANTSDPRVPANFLATIQGILGLSHFATERKVQEAVVVPAYGSKPHFGPTDLYTFYDEAPLLERGIKGTMAPDCIALIETQDAPNDAVDLFVQQFALPPINVTRVLTDPTAPITLATSPEPLLDTEWAHAVAPATPIQLYIGNTPGSSDPVLDAFKLAINDNICGVISASIHTCPHVPKIPEILFYDSLFTQAVVQGQTVFHASGDFGSYFQCPNPVTGQQPSVDEAAASPNVTVVGGTQFIPGYDSAGNDLSIVSDGLEQAWNEAHPPGDKGETGGGMSAIFPKL
jgi:subtilase family serine protease